MSPKTGGNERAHDLVDLQLLAQEEQIDFVDHRYYVPAAVRCSPQSSLAADSRRVLGLGDDLRRGS